MDKLNTGSFFSDVQFNNDKPAISVILETSNSKEIRILLGKGQIMKAHKAPFPIIVQVLDGDIDFGVSEQSVNLKSGDLITLEANVIHDLKANLDSNVRLSLNKNDSSSRVAKVVE